MTRGRTSSPLGLSARRERARELFSRGFTNADVAREILVSPETAARYRVTYEDELKETAKANPNMLRDILGNTVRTLRELDQVRAAAWQNYEASQTDAAKATFLNTALKASDQRAKLLQLFGVKAEYMSQVAVIQRNQEALIKFLAEGEWCDHDRMSVVSFLETQIDMTDLDALPTTEEPAR
jgi:hypothetical protein